MFRKTFGLFAALLMTGGAIQPGSASTVKTANTLEQRLKDARSDLLDQIENSDLANGKDNSPKLAQWGNYWSNYVAPPWNNWNNWGNWGNWGNFWG